MLQLVVALLAGGASVALGVLVVLRAQGARRRIGWLLLAHGLTLALFLAQPGTPATDHTGMVLDQLTQGSWVLLFLWLELVAYLLPDGRPASPRWAAWIRVGLVGCVLFVVAAAGDQEGFRQAHGGRAAPVRWPSGTPVDVLGVVGFVLVVALLFGSFVSLWRRTRRAVGEERLQLLWPLWGALFVPMAIALGWVDHFLLGDRLPFEVVLAVIGVALPATIAASVLRHRLLDIELVLSRTLTYAALTALVVGAYAGLLALAELLGGRSSAGGLVAVGLVAVLVHPTYDRLRRRVERLVHGDRSDPAAAMRRLGADAAAADPLHLVETVARSVAEALRVDEAWVEPAGTPARDDTAVRVPLVHRGTRIGDLAVAVPPGRRLGAADLALLQDLARHAAVTVRSGQLAVELQESRSRIVTAREEERRRLRRDLHDGVGPSLAAIVLTLDAVQGIDDQERRRALVAEVQDEARAMVREVRRLVDDLRPAAIDEVGLVAAIRQRAAALSTDALACVVTGPDQVPALPAAVEVAAYRIASEAMTNVVRHSGASRCTVEIELDGGTLGVTVSDNGRGASGPSGTGVGWASMTERAAELGGACTVSSRADGGLVVRAVLPLVEVGAVDLEESR